MASRRDPVMEDRVDLSLMELVEKQGNGSVLLHHGPEKGRKYALKSIAYFEFPDGVAVAAYNTPKNLHALTQNQQMEHFLILEQAQKNPDIKVLVWTATGTRAFNAGAALRGEFTIQLPKHTTKAYSEVNMSPIKGDFVLARLTKAFWDFPKPLIMAVNGLAVGGGANIALANFADIVIASTNARFMYPFSKIGFTPELGSSLMIPFVTGMTQAKRILMAGEWFSAEEAKTLGLVTKVHSAETLFSEAILLARELASRKQGTLREMKKLLNAPLRQQLDHILDEELIAFQKSLASLETNPLAKL
eukprot:m.71219 g.71219  ORF g.71219 m.71219 type:complete len:304 (+) comp24328_c0_seq2:26-937(+)